MAELGLAGLADYQSYLEHQSAEWPILDTLCWIPISRFYRDRGAFQQLQLEVLPQLGRMVMARGADTVRCWSVGCASGEEPYTVAIMWKLAVAPRFPGLRLRMLGTDVDRDAIERALRGCYAAHSVRELPETWRAQAFRTAPAGLVVDGDYREGVEFRVQDVRTTLPDGPFELILCRNVVFTYFDTELQQQTLRRLVLRLSAGAALMIGGSESLPAGVEGLEPWPAARKVFRRVVAIRAPGDRSSGAAIARDSLAR